MKPTAVVIALLFTSSILGCYNTYTISRDEFARLQRAPDDASRKVTVKDAEDKNVVVEGGTQLYVRSVGGRRYPVTAFNFKLTESQLVASDRDTLLAVDGLASYEVDHLSTWKTVGLVSLGAAALAGVVVAIIVTAAQDTKGFE